MTNIFCLGFNGSIFLSSRMTINALLRHIPRKINHWFAHGVGLGLFRVPLAGCFKQTLVVLHSQKMRYGLIESFFGKVTVFDGLLDSEEALRPRFIVGFQEYRIATSLDRHGAGLRKRPLFQDGGHTDRVGNNHAVETEFFPAAAR